MNRRSFVFGATVAGLFQPGMAFGQSCTRNGQFVGPLRTRNLSPDGQRRRLLADFSYRDKCARTWKVPAETPLDGASIPPLFWQVVGKPWEGLYVQASVIHDYGCYRRIEYPATVHRLFHEGMLVSGVDSTQAKIMYLAVVYGGPDWDWATVDANRQAAGLPAYPPPPPEPPRRFPAIPALPGLVVPRIIAPRRRVRDGATRDWDSSGDSARADSADSVERDVGLDTDYSATSDDGYYSAESAESIESVEAEAPSVSAAAPPSPNAETLELLAARVASDGLSLEQIDALALEVRP